MKDFLKRGVLITAANWHVVIVQFVADALFKTLLAVPIVGGVFLAVLLIGGAARSAAVQAVAPGVLSAPVLVPTPGEWVARGAARQAAWALTGRLPDWPVESVALEAGSGAAHVREQ